MSPQKTSKRRSLLRRMGIGPRLWLFLAIPAVALVTLVGLLVVGDVRTVDDLYDFQSTTTRVADLVDARTSIQDERHALLDDEALKTLEQRPLADELLGDDTVDILNTVQSRVDVGDELITARALASSGQLTEAVARYNTIIGVIDASVRSLLNESPDGEIDRRADALVALLDVEEAALLEDLNLQRGSNNRLIVARLHAAETEGLVIFARDASPEGIRELEAMTISDAWRESISLRTEFLDGAGRVDQARWSAAASERRAAISSLLENETMGLEVTTATLAERGRSRLIVIGGLVAAALIVGALVAFSIRRSIIHPLGILARAASQLSKGELEPVDDPASDEIASVASAFSSLHNTMEALWSDLDEVERSVRRREFDKRIATDSLEGDWLRLANTLNATLTEGELHSKAQSAELLRRNVLAEISGAALVAENGPALTTLVLRHLPAAVPGSHAHLHRHPSGPPAYDLGIELEPSISALELPSLADEAQIVELRDTTGIASLVNFGTGSPAVLVLAFGEVVPDDCGPLIGLVETAARVLAQGHRRQVAEWSATHNLEHDALTGLFNTDGLRRWFKETDNASNGDLVVIGIQPLRLDVLDSSEGREARNALVTIASRRIRQVLNEHDLIARIGEPEFVVVAQEYRANDVIARIVDAFAHPLSIGYELVSVDLGIGVAKVDGEIEDAIADAATAVRQGDGRNTTIVHFDEQLREDAVRQNDIERWLETAIDKGELEVHFQPVVNAVSTAIEGYECLVRGKRNGVPVSPGEFIPLAEASMRILEIGDFTLREACAALPFLPGDSPYVAVNLSPLELSDPDLITRMETILSSTAVDRSRIVMEVTEGAATSDTHIELLHRIRGIGVKIAIDDFGSGHANLSYLANMPAQIVKLDRSLITPMVHDRNARTVVGGAIEMAHNIGMSVVAEGVESDEELNLLRRVRCDRIQGWLTGRPAPLRDLIDITEPEPAQVRTMILPPKAIR